MIINTNIGSLNAQRNLTSTQNSMQSSLQKLSSGYRINSAADDAAGLAITQKMQGQISGLNQAVQNSQSAISLIQTGEGALNETQSILQRMRELAVQSASSTNTTDDRAKIQSETDQLTQEISRISNTTQFNTQNLLAGGLNDTFQIGANKDQNIALSVSAMDAKSLGVAATLYTTALNGGTSVGLTGISNVSSNLSGDHVKVTVSAATATAVAGAIGGTFAVNNQASYSGVSNSTFQIQVTSTSAVGGSNVANGIEYSTDAGQTWTSATRLTAVSASRTDWSIGNNLKIHLTATSATSIKQNEVGTISASAKTAVISLTDSSNTLIGTAVTINANASSATIGDANAGTTANISINFNSLATSAGVGINQNAQAATAAVVDVNGNVVQNAVTNKGINVMTQTAANNAIQTIDNAINRVSQERSKLGAYQNRLEHTINNLSTSSQNLTAAQSGIKDVDMASEMSNFTKSQILSQAGVAMLAQANQAPQAVLKLLG